jgi:hypothetical protein
MKCLPAKAEKLFQYALHRLFDARNSQVENTADYNDIKRVFNLCFIYICTKKFNIRIFAFCQFNQVFIYVYAAVICINAFLFKKPAEISLAASEVQDSVACQVPGYLHKGLIPAGLTLRRPPHSLRGITEVLQVSVIESQKLLFAEGVHCRNMVSQIVKTLDGMVNLGITIKEFFMEDFQYKQYTKEENKIYNEAMDAIMEGLKNGLSFHEACGSVEVQDEELKNFILDDALKIMIADMHYVKSLSLQDISDSLRLPVERIEKANQEMLEDISITNAQVFKLMNNGTQCGNA